VIQGPFTTPHYPNLPAQQHRVQRIADEFNAAEREWERKHPPKPKRKRNRNSRKTGAVASMANTRPANQTIGFAKA
jgi:hypothetical protein